VLSCLACGLVCPSLNWKEIIYHLKTVFNVKLISINKIFNLWSSSISIFLHVLSTLHNASSCSLSILGSFLLLFFKFNFFYFIAILLTKIYNTLHYVHYSHYLQHSTLLRFPSLLHTRNGKEKKKREETTYNICTLGTLRYHMYICWPT